MSTYYTHTDKNKGNLLTSADWNKLSNAVAGNQGLHLALDAANKVGIGTNDPKAALSILGDGKEDWPDGSMHITSDCILFGGKNSGKEVNSAQISAGRHQADTLCIVGMGSTANNRKIKMWAEGGLAVSGAIKVPYKGGNEASISIGDNSFHNGNIYALRFGDSETNQLGMGTYTSDKKVFSDSSNGLGIHVKNNAEFSVKSSGWDNLFGIKGGTGNAYFKGNVGIGTTSPGEKLEVNGTAKVSMLKIGNIVIGEHELNILKKLASGNLSVNIQSRVHSNQYLDHYHGRVNQGDSDRTIQMQNGKHGNHTRFKLIIDNG